jgi:hypothetical protein
VPSLLVVVVVVISLTLFEFFVTNELIGNLFLGAHLRRPRSTTNCEERVRQQNTLFGRTGKGSWTIFCPVVWCVRE